MQSPMLQTSFLPVPLGKRRSSAGNLADAWFKTKWQAHPDRLRMNHFQQGENSRSTPDSYLNENMPAPVLAGEFYRNSAEHLQENLARIGVIIRLFLEKNRSRGWGREPGFLGPLHFGS